MRRVAACLVYLLLVVGVVVAHSAAEYRALFAPEYAAGEHMARAVYSRLLERLGNAELSRIGTAVVFPELTRYSYIENVAETSALELSYVLGLGADFSIGKLQMKPSFAQKVETEAGPRLLARFPGIRPTGSNEKAIRGERILRLKSDARQADYLAVFLLIMERRFPAVARHGVAAVRLFSAAYNGGIDLSRKDLEAVASECLFPYGKRYEGDEFCYADIAVQYYDQESR